jgi:flagellar biogenesis protein FliO
MLAPQQVTGAEPTRRWLPLALVGLVAVTAGLVLPQALPTAAPAAKAPAPGDAAAKSKWAYAPPAAPEPGDARAMLTRLGVATVVVLALCVVTLWLGKRWLGGAAPAVGKASQLRLVETLALGNRCAVHLIHVGNRPVLVGADQSGVKTVVPLPESFMEHALALSGEGAVEKTEGASAAMLYQRTVVPDGDPSCLTR